MQIYACTCTGCPRTQGAEPLGDIRRSSCGEGDVERLCSSVVRAIDQQSKDLGSNPSAVESVIFSTERFSNPLNIVHINIFEFQKKME